MDATSTSNRRSLLVVGLVLVSLFVAVGGSGRGDDAAELSSGITDPVASWSLTAGDLVHEIARQDGTRRATGGYVPGRGVVVTAEISELAIPDIEAWARERIDRAGPELGRLPHGEAVVFLVDIAAPQRTTRLFRIDPATPNAPIAAAPATSTAPLSPTFDDEERP